MLTGMRRAWRRIVRALCWFVQHTPDTERPLKLFNEDGSLVMRQWRCERCRNLYWTFGWSHWIQVHDDDPRVVSMMR